ncbi:DUF5984 family protein [Couchioplanes caeruleus]|uniref:DUF5984 family protein n=1 Tax=Couchioplanes caeruleus TaxID=56438 RepID=UPI00373FDD7C
MELTLPAVEFFAAVEDFDRRFIAAMGERVAEMGPCGPPAGVDLALKQLRREHTQRSRCLEQRLAEPRNVAASSVTCCHGFCRTSRRLPTRNEPGDRPCPHAQHHVRQVARTDRGRRVRRGSRRRI